MQQLDPPQTPDPLPLSPSSTLSLLRTALHDRTVGALVGSALGDTIGLYTEFMSAAHAAASYPSRAFTLAPPAGPTPFKVDAHRAPKELAHWTDDTDHALLLLMGFLRGAGEGRRAGRDGEGPGRDREPPRQPPLPTQQDFAARLRVWVEQGFCPLGTMPLGLGRLVGSVVASAGFEADPEAAARAHWERTGKRAAPNGSLMRTHVLGLMCLWREERAAFEAAASISRATHVDPRCVVACAVGTALVRAVVRGEVEAEAELDALVERAVRWYKEEGEREGADGQEVELDVGELRKHVDPEGGLDALNLDDPPAVGYVYKTLGSGVVLLRMAIRRRAGSNGGMLDRSRMFEELITDLVMRGGDADTNACFAGALLGGYLGYSALPDHWKHGLKHEEWLLGKADALCQVLGLKAGTYNGLEDGDTELYGGRPVVSQQEMEARWMALQQATFKKMEDKAKASASKVAGSGWSFPWQSKDKGKR